MFYKENNKVKSKLYWCEACNVPIFHETCEICGSEGKYIGVDCRPVFPEEKLLIALILKKEAKFYEKASVWNVGQAYIVNGKKVKIVIKDLKNKSFEELARIRKNYVENVKSYDYSYFNQMVKVFRQANKIRFNEITEEASRYIQGYKEKYDIKDMFVSFSGGKDSTVTSDLVTNALSTKKILHIFGDTTLEFPLTYIYKDRFRKNPENRGLTILTAKNREKNFNDLCNLIGPPSRLMRWCCTVFKTGAIQKTISSAFRNKDRIITFYGIRRSESISRSKYERETESPKITKQIVVSPIIDWIDFDVWLYLLTREIDFNDAYRLGFARVGCWCCPNNSNWSEFLVKIHMFDKYTIWHKLLVNFAEKIGKLDAEDYINDGFWKARQGGNGVEIAQNSVIKWEPCATEETSFNYVLNKEIDDNLYELFKPFGYLNFSLGNKRLGEVYVCNKAGQVQLILQGRKGSKNLKVIIKNQKIAKARNIKQAERKIQCQITKFQMCINCNACESVCKYDALKVKIVKKTGKLIYKIDDEKCIRCGECIAHFDGGCYMRKVLTIKR